MGKGGENQIQEQYSPEKRMQFWMFLDVLDLLVRIGMKASIINNKYNKYHVTPPPHYSRLSSSPPLLFFSPTPPYPPYPPYPPSILLNQLIFYQLN
jgi:hypothetical protein